jgi:hypothetical protein
VILSISAIVTKETEIQVSEFCRMLLSTSRRVAFKGALRPISRGLFFVVAACASSYAQVDVLTQHNDNARTGANLHETLLTPENVDKARFGMLFKRVVDDQLYTQPLVATGVEVDGGTRDLVYVTTVNNSV